MIAQLFAPSDRAPVIENIEKAVASDQFNRKVETDDPNISNTKEKQLLADYVQNLQTWSYRVNNLTARTAMNAAARIITRDMPIDGQENLAKITGGAIVTSNHFSPIENMLVRRGMGMHRLYIISEATNFFMDGWLGYLMRYADTIPISKDLHYAGITLPEMLKKRLDAGARVLIYPEQEMWFNYRKPRPPKRGAYFYAAQLQVPIISCFVEIADMPKQLTDQFNETQYRLHILPPIFPDTSLSPRDDSLRMEAQDYAQKKAAYEKAYQRPLDYDFSPADIAGWTGRLAVQHGRN
ncbi:MAG: 1-acyl-sn-glycerol-3-phosphate acyltransferase [Schleiferilactobacillus harbinensis]|jgi:1-acyl-sn-glycerol-3-phosphate acyltransferase|uniref:1-acyl-sn-glycerol-3-phosphate acyltransferase n=1 Tax=Schleiferilactobacillus perolens DSM 12744 TaxID=1423792 RepID=A0A0R1MSL9_9LACO|nr:lysophospholipid acyltransferase family protein [Schleiferilactobacillus perolens]KRL11325.1 1-acyl-sn-glycerol-3-phosphate acyltransferase [Schleiferilactobacillus perolens DSM 12744]MCI1893116.1 1-acyl-sn-glycerol-3-phosphate acyltransferase [Schleiferilactobacillus harbinensis]MCI1913911.1 1-acyl-sn-glycerol-3-phosphate acyltransferase [Schleiferilactobacillus harbinensis]